MIVYRPAPARHGYLAIVGGDVIPVPDLAAAARHMAAARPAGASFDVRARITLTRERVLTPDEIGRLLSAATTLLTP